MTTTEDTTRFLFKALDAGDRDAMLLLADLAEEHGEPWTAKGWQWLYHHGKWPDSRGTFYFGAFSHGRTDQLPASAFAIWPRRNLGEPRTGVAPIIQDAAVTIGRLLLDGNI